MTPEFRLATAADLPAVVRLLADDPLGAAREHVAEPLPDAYERAFAAMQAQAGNLLIVATHVGMKLALAAVPASGQGLSRVGAPVAMTEPADPSTPMPAHVCPLCGGPNACAVAQSGSFDTPCWCREVSVSPDLVARLPEERRGQACLCQECVTRAATSVDEP